jgi:hypothetical protein
MFEGNARAGHQRCVGHVVAKQRKAPESFSLGEGPSFDVSVEERGPCKARQLKKVIVEGASHFRIARRPGPRSIARRSRRASSRRRAGCRHYLLSALVGVTSFDPTRGRSRARPGSLPDPELVPDSATIGVWINALRALGPIAPDLTRDLVPSRPTSAVHPLEGGGPP